jgi:tRNA-binding protein
MHVSFDPSEPAAATIDFEQFLAVDLRLGTVLRAAEFPEARRPAYKLEVDFGPGVGIRRSSAQITEHYAVEELAGRQVLAVVNLPPRQVGPFLSEVLVLSFCDASGAVVLACVDQPVANGTRLT